MRKTTLEIRRRPAMTTVNFPVFLFGWSINQLLRPSKNLSGASAPQRFH
jgi:hypothetical protein